MFRSAVRSIALIAAGVALAGCETTVSQEELASVKYGPKPLAWQDEIASYLKLRVPDPNTVNVLYKTEPQQMVQKETILRERQWGWATCIWVNENHPRGYQGFYPMTFFFRDGKIVAVNGGPDDAGVPGPQYAREQCERLGAPFRQ